MVRVFLPGRRQLCKLSALVQPKHGDRTELQGSGYPNPRLYTAHSF
jgi:hypothetical protein